MTNLFTNFFINCDAPRPWGIYFQDSASPQMEALIELHDNIMFYLVIILIGVAWILVSIIRNYVNHKSPISNKYLNHGTLIELIWTITPALILILIAFPSFKLLYLMDEVTDPSLIVFVEGHQWYWSYQYPDFLNDDDEELEFELELFSTNGYHSELEVEEILRNMPNENDGCSWAPIDIAEDQRSTATCSVNPTLLPSGQWSHHLAHIENKTAWFCHHCNSTICDNCLAE